MGYAGAEAEISLRQLDEQLEGLPGLTEDERSMIWLYAWATRETVARVAALHA